MTSSAVMRMISKSEETGCLDNRPHSFRPSTSANAALLIQEIVAGSSTYRGVSAREGAHHTVIQYITNWGVHYDVLIYAFL